MRKLRRIIRAWQTHGTMGLASRILHQKCPIHSCRIYHKDQAAITRPFNGLTVKRYDSFEKLESSTTQAIESVKGEEARGQLRRLFALGCELWIGSLDKTVVAICWSRSGQKRSDYFVRLDETDGTILSCFVSPDFRGRGIFPAMLESMVNAMMDQGRVARVFIDCKSSNTSSMRGIEKAQFKFIGTALRLVLFERMWVLKNDCSPPTSLSRNSHEPTA